MRSQVCSYMMTMVQLLMLKAFWPKKWTIANGERDTICTGCPAIDEHIAETAVGWKREDFWNDGGLHNWDWHGMLQVNNSIWCCWTCYWWLFSMKFAVISTEKSRERTKTIRSSTHLLLWHMKKEPEARQVTAWEKEMRQLCICDMEYLRRLDCLMHSLFSCVMMWRWDVHMQDGLLAGK